MTPVTSRMASRHTSDSASVSFFLPHKSSFCTMCSAKMQLVVGSHNAFGPSTAIPFPPPSLLSTLGMRGHMSAVTFCHTLTTKTSMTRALAVRRHQAALPRHLYCLPLLGPRLCGHVEELLALAAAVAAATTARTRQFISACPRHQGRKTPPCSPLLPRPLRTKKLQQVEALPLRKRMHSMRKSLRPWTAHLKKVGILWALPLRPPHQRGRPWIRPLLPPLLSRRNTHLARSILRALQRWHPFLAFLPQGRSLRTLLSLLLLLYRRLMRRWPLPRDSRRPQRHRLPTNLPRSGSSLPPLTIFGSLSLPWPRPTPLWPVHLAEVRLLPPQLPRVAHANHHAGAMEARIFALVQLRWWSLRRNWKRRNRSRKVHDLALTFLPAGNPLLNRRIPLATPGTTDPRIQMHSVALGCPQRDMLNPCHRGPDRSRLELSRRNILQPQPQQPQQTLKPPKLLRLLLLQ